MFPTTRLPEYFSDFVPSCPGSLTTKTIYDISPPPFDLRTQHTTTQAEKKTSSFFNLLNPPSLIVYQGPELAQALKLGHRRRTEINVHILDIPLFPPLCCPAKALKVDHPLEVEVAFQFSKFNAVCPDKVKLVKSVFILSFAS